MSSLTKRFALWGLPNSSKTTFLGTLLHVLNEEATQQQPEFGFLKSYQALQKNQWPPKLDLTIEMVRFQIEHEGIPYEITLLDPPGAFLDPNANPVTCPAPYENRSLYQFYAECDGILALFDHRTTQGERAAAEDALGHLFQKLREISPSAVKPHFLYGLTKAHPDSIPTPTQHPPLTYLSHRVIDPQHPIFDHVDSTRRPHEANTFWVYTAFERDGQVEPWMGSIFNVRDLLVYLFKPKTHPQAPESLKVTQIHVPSSHPRLPEMNTPPIPPTLPELMPNIFISHNTIDAPFVNPLAETLRQHGIGVWKAPESILPGEDWVDAIERGLSQSTHVVLVLSPGAVESDWVRLEMNTAIRLEREGKIKIIPLNYQPCEVPLLWGNYQAINCNTAPQHILTDLLRRLGISA